YYHNHWLGSHDRNLAITSIDFPRRTRLGSTAMELRHLRYFVAVAETLSFTKGAKKLHLAQPSLTRQIKDLENEIDVLLVDRRNQQIRLTDEGRSFLVDAKRLLDLAQEMVESVQRLKHG